VIHAHRLLFVLLALAASGCATLTEPSMKALRRPLAQGALHAPLLPIGGRQLVIIGQSPDSAEHEPGDLGPPGAVMLYASLRPEQENQFIQAITTADSAATRNPQSALQVGLSLIDRLDAIDDGSLDANIDTLIQALMQTRRPVYLRFGYEFDFPGNHYEPEPFRKAWVRFRWRLTLAHATNIAMIWHSASGCGGTYGGRPIWSWYPGDDAVDWVGVSWFAATSCNYSVPLAMVDFAREHRKPLMIAEATPRGYDLAEQTRSYDNRHFQSMSPGDIWDEWYLPYFTFAKTNADVVRAIAYINDDWEANRRASAARGYVGNGRLDTNPGVASRWAKEMRNPRWLRGGPDLPRQLSSQ
jgi:hypothetical protein